jgi:signal transduction histidine kinase
MVSQVRSSVPVLAEKGSLPSRLAASRLPTHIPDLTALEGDYRDDVWNTVVAKAGFRSTLVVPLLKDEEISRDNYYDPQRVQPFTDNKISLFSDFAAQASIALASTRRERQYREIQSELAHANRVATVGQLTASIAHEIKQPIATGRDNACAALRFLDKSPPDVARRSPMAWAWASRSAARLSRPMVGGYGRPGVSRGALSFSLRSSLTEPPS